MKFEDLLKEVKEMGRYQWRLFAVITMTATTGAESVAANFIAGMMDHWCRVQEIQGLPADAQKQIAIPLKTAVDDSTESMDDIESDSMYSHCDMYDMNYTAVVTQLSHCVNSSVAWDELNGTCSDTLTRLHNGTSIVECGATGWVYDDSQYTSTIVSQWDLVCHRSWMIALTNSFFMGGLLVGSFLGGVLSDKIGRRKTFWIFYTVRVVGSFIAMFAPTVWVYSVGRLIQGSGSLASHLAVFVLLMEFIGHKWRPVLGIFIGVGYFLSLMYLNLLGYLIKDHFHLQLAFNIPFVLMYACYPILPESPRWLIVQRRYPEAEKILREVAAMNKSTLPEPLNLSHIEVEQSEGKRSQIVKLFRYPKVRLRTAIISLHWFSDSLMYYAIFLNVDALHGDSHTTTLLLTLFEIPVAFISVLCLRWKVTGRRLTCALSLIIAGASSFLAIPFVLNGPDSAIIVLTIISKVSVSTAFASIYVYSSEVFPTEARNMGMGIASTCARISGMAAPFVGPPLATVWLPLPSVILGVVSTLAGGLTLILPETLGQKLPETVEEAETFEGARVQCCRGQEVLVDSTRHDVQVQVPLLDDMEHTSSDATSDVADHIHV